MNGDSVDSAGSVTGALRALGSPATRIAITGASGWLGRELIDVLLSAWGEQCRDRILPLASRDQRMTLASGRRVDVHALAHADVASFAPTHIVHLAFLTRDRMAEVDPIEYASLNRWLMEQARVMVHLPSVRGVLFTSSGAVLTTPKDHPGSLYAELKREEQRLIETAATAAGKNTVVARVWSVSGANVTKIDGFAFSSLVHQALLGGPIAVRADHPVFRRYVDAGEFAALASLALLSGESAVIDSAGERLEIGELAARIAQQLSPESAVIRPPLLRAPIDDYCADPTSLNLALDRYQVQLTHLAGQIAKSAAGLVVRGETGGHLQPRNAGGGSPSGPRSFA